MKTNPPLVTMAPGGPGVPRRAGTFAPASALWLRMKLLPFPNGTRHLMSPLVRSMAVRCA